MGSRKKRFNPLSGEAGCATNSTLMFAAETCVVKVDAMSMRGDVYDKYKDYCRRNNYKPVTQANFNNEVMKAYPFGRRVWRGMAYIGDND
jgi:putative DNA primase/helicase